MEKKLSTVNIPDGFTKWDFNIDHRSYKTFAWWGELLVSFDGEQKIVSASGHASGNSGDMEFKFTGGDFTQEEVNRLEIIAYKTDPEILY
ncbi:MAG: hypothetical protein Q4F84_08615 [Fibrobacter sp.]|nr:hypothetical protein [Fibrobacter sp.]